MALAFAAPANRCQAEERFPPPDFTRPDYVMPAPTTPPARASFYDVLDTGVLLASLVAASYLVFRRRSRRGIFWLMLFSVVYFGFWRKGCVCPIGAIQNVTQALVDSSFALPAVVAAFFFLPLVAALFYGRVFCAAVCPHGALQDAVLSKPVRVPVWLNHALGLLPFLYLGCAVLFAALGSAYIICEYAPFVTLFRRGGRTTMLVLAGAFVLLAVFVGRPYCRFVCPYGALLRLFSQISRRRVKIYPDRCIDCHLCDETCPYGAIHKTTPQQPAAHVEGKGRFVALALLLPVLIAGGGWLGTRLAAPLSRMDYTVRVADQVRLEESGAVTEPADPSKDPSRDPSRAFYRTGRTTESLYADADAVYKRFKTGGAWLGAWMGLVVGLKLLALSVRRRFTEYEADRSWCVACARCFEYCPGEKGALDPSVKAPGPLP